MEENRPEGQLNGSFPSATDPAHKPEPQSSPDWRIWFGLGVSGFWLILLSVYIEGTIGWAQIGHAPIQTLGNFLEGAFAPLAFLWLVIGYFLQKKELAQNTEAIRMQYVEIQKSTAQATIQAEAIKASEMHARRESFLRIAGSVREQLGAIMGFLYISSQGQTGSGFVSNERIAELWSKMNRSDPEVFSRSMLELQSTVSATYAFKLLFGTPVRTRHTENFIFHFERLLRAAADCDEDGMIRDALLGSGHGYIYQRMIRHRDSPPAGMQVGRYDFDPDTDEQVNPD